MKPVHFVIHVPQSLLLLLSLFQVQCVNLHLPLHLISHLLQWQLQTLHPRLHLNPGFHLFNFDGWFVLWWTSCSNTLIPLLMYLPIYSWTGFSSTLMISLRDIMLLLLLTAALFVCHLAVAMSQLSCDGFLQHPTGFHSIVLLASLLRILISWSCFLDSGWLQKWYGVTKREHPATGTCMNAIEAYCRSVWSIMSSS